MRSNARNGEIHRSSSTAVPVTFTGSRSVQSPQNGPHRQLERLVRRHLESTWKAPLPRHTVEAFDQVSQLLDAHERSRLIFDSGCGTGASARRLARSHPDCIVIGIDQSARRLSSLIGQTLAARVENAIWVRAELSAFWRLALEHRWRPVKHYLLYPNPWPKPRHLARRWHGHPVFPVLLELGGEIELRCNWRTYAEEFARAVSMARGTEPRIEPFAPEDPLTPFEAKYLASGHALYRVIVQQKEPRFPGALKCY